MAKNQATTTVNTETSTPTPDSIHDSSEEHLLARARTGDRAALSQLVEQHLQPIYRVALRMCGNVNDAEETLQETFLSAVKGLPQFEGRARFSTWLYRIASNACFMHRRRHAAEPEMLPIETDDPSDTQSDSDYAAFIAPRLLHDWSAQPDDVALDHELQERLQAAITQLSPSLRLVFIWRDIEGLSTTETAEILNISESAVKVRLHRARLQLREMLATYFPPHPATRSH